MFDTSKFRKGDSITNEVCQYFHILSSVIWSLCLVHYHLKRIYRIFVALYTIWTIYCTKLRGYYILERVRDAYSCSIEFGLHIFNLIKHRQTKIYCG